MTATQTEQPATTTKQVETATKTTQSGPKRTTTQRGGDNNESEKTDGRRRDWNTGRNWSGGGAEKKRMLFYID